MFSREWFIYVFGRWILLSGIAGAALQVLLRSQIGIPDFPAFLLNQLLLACVFWYVDKYIFQRHFGKVKDLFKFPRVKGQFDTKREFTKITEEYDQFAADFQKEPDNPQAWLNRYLDLYHSVEMMERVLRDKGIDVDREYHRIVEDNRKRGLYE
ncbi:MAG: hypothetical protein NTZ34_11960 [Chloroflexi bacterium]|nr:hypothetical protein [Chloroflexota bacterium]